MKWWNMKTDINTMGIFQRINLLHGERKISKFNHNYLFIRHRFKNSSVRQPLLDGTE